MKLKTGCWAFALLALLIAAMALATWSEHVQGGAYAFGMFYNSRWFVLLWIAMTTAALYHIAVSSLGRRPSVWLLHASFLLMLIGALTTRLTGKTGQVHLRENHRAVAFFLDESSRRKIDFPFSLALKSFETAYYPGTATPADYISVVEVRDADGGNRFEREISMNRILRYRGFRFYQSSFDEDGKGSILSVNRDTWGVALSYSGYFLMFFSMLWTLLDKRERFRQLLKKLSRKTAAWMALLFLPAFASAASPVFSHDSLTISAGQAKKWGEVWVEYHGRICPLQTVANDFTVKLVGKDHYRYASGEQVFFGWLFFPEKWQHVPMFKVKSEELRRRINVPEEASLADFMDAAGFNKLDACRRQMYDGGKQEGWLKEAVKIDEKIQLVEMLLKGSLLKVFPANLPDGGLRWISPDMEVQSDSMENLFVRHFFPMYFESLMQGNDEETALYPGKLAAFQRMKAGELLPSAARMKAELLYNRLHLFSWLFMICLTVGSACLLFFIVATLRNRPYPLVERVFYGLLLSLFLLATAGLALRTYISGRIPVSNGYETMLLLSWFSLLTGIAARRYSLPVTAFGLLSAGFTLLVAHIGSMSPQITPLVPVLQSPLLSVHVLVIMMAYGLCGFMALNAIASIAVRIAGSRAGAERQQAYIERMKEVSELFMYPATFLMGTGIFVGAVWANMSWGRYWGWDPKEVWALITFLLMSFTFHEKTLTWFRNPLFYHIFVLIIFLSVLMTYFGVNYILGGKHSYAG
ncbi:MAG: cytochrome c biogenesis protein CcsA [Bacteroidales bacterium]|jgi:ABC-type transport system involved in cytochrome c biogenesis permease subunit|nr:cytochrome c biogenesis protein CcsA [Bacteroidales bacterium]